MSQKSAWKSVIATIIITLVILAGLSYVGIKYLLPYYQVNQDQVYDIAIKLFPLIIGLIMILAGVMISRSKDKEAEDDTDKLPPNAYDESLFSTDSDDKSTETLTSEISPEPAEEVQPEPPFVSIFSEPVEQEPQMVKKEIFSEPVEEEPQMEEKKIFSEDEEEVLSPFESEPEKPIATEPEKPIATEPEKEVKTEDPLVSSVNTLVEKLSTFLDLFTAEEEDVEEEAEEYDIEPEEDSKRLDFIEDELKEIKYLISQGRTASYSKPLSPTEELAKELKALKEEMYNRPLPPINITLQMDKDGVVSAPAAKPVVAAAPAPVADKPYVEGPSTLEEVDIPYDEPFKQKAYLELKAAKDMDYTIAFALIDASNEEISSFLDDSLDYFDVDGKTFIIYPFANKEETEDRLEKLGKEFKVSGYDGDSSYSVDRAMEELFQA